VVVCKKDNNQSCYIKGRLQPSRSIGDFRLKYAEFNNPKNYPSEMEFQSPLKNFSGNYITAVPEVKSFDLSKKHRSVVIASDGLWDKLGRQEVAEVVRKHPVSEVPNVLINKCLEKAAEEIKSTVREIRLKPQGKKRKIHDDITVVVVDLTKQAK
jgi:pyruvate dehydrogenase phosphatase